MKKKCINFFRPFWDPNYYTKEHFYFSSGFGRLLGTGFFLSLILALYFFVAQGLRLPEQIETFARGMEKGYPDDLKLTFDGNELDATSNGLVQLYSVPSNWKRPLKTEYLIAVNDDEKMRHKTINELEESKSVIYFAKDGLVYREGRYRHSFVDYGEFGTPESPLTVTKAKITSIASTFSKHAWMMPYALSLAIVIFGTLSVFQYLLSGLFFALVLFLTAKLGWYRRVFTYGQSYVITFYLLAPVLLIKSAAYVLIPALPRGVPFLTLILVLLLARYFFVSGKKKIEDQA